MITSSNGLRLSGPEDSLISAQEISMTVHDLAAYYNDAYQDIPNITALTILNGAKPFAEALIPLLKPGVVSDQMKVSSMDGDKSSGRLAIETHPMTDLKDKDVLVIEDLVDTGLTLSGLARHLIEERRVHSLHIVALFEKPECRLPNTEIPNLKTGIRIANKFVVGFGLDWNQKYRELDYLTTAIQTAPNYYEPAVKAAA